MTRIGPYKVSAPLSTGIDEHGRTSIAEVKVDNERHASCLDAPPEIDSKLRAVGSSSPDADACCVRTVILRAL